MMHPNDFRLFLEVVELGSFTKVAAQRQTAQSNISRQIGNLEVICGQTLFRRTGRGVVLTEFGGYVEKKIRAWIKNSDELFSDIQASSKLPMGEVKLGILPSAAHPLITHVYQVLQANYPKIKLNIREGQGGELDTLLDSGSVDMAILFRYQKPSGPDEALLATGSTYLVSGPNAPLTQNSSIDFESLKNIPLVLPRRPAHWRSILDETARSKGFTLQAEIEADSLSVQKELLQSNPNLYALLGPFSIHAELLSGELQATKVMNPDLQRFVTLALPKQGQMNQTNKIVSKIIKETTQGWGNQLNIS